MENKLTIRDQVCPNPLCHFYGKAHANNIVIHSKKKERLQCKVCKRTWASYSHAFYFGLKTPKEKIQEAKRLLQQGVSIRMIAHFVGVSPSTIQRWKRDMRTAPNVHVP